MRRIKIEHPEWLAHSKSGESIAAFNKGLYPDVIAGWMLVVSLKHPLRAIYGTDLRAALALLWMALWNPVQEWLLSIKYRKEIFEWTKEWDSEDEVAEFRAAAKQGKN